MKKITVFTLALAMIFTLSACSELMGISPTLAPQTTPPATAQASPTAAPEPTPTPAPVKTLPPVGPEDVELALVTGTGGIEDMGLGEGAWKGISAYAADYGKSFDYYPPYDDSTDAYVEAMTTAIEMGARAVVVTGSQFGEALATVAAKNPDVMFLGLDVADAGIGLTARKNLSLVVFKEQEAGFMAGYAAVMDGYSKMGFIGGVADPAIIRYGYGFLQGADTAAAALDTDVEINYWYSGVFRPDDTVYDAAFSWYSAGTEVIFACGGGLNLSVMYASQNAGGDIIGVGVDQSHVGEMFVTSALKEHAAATVRALTDLYDNGREWPDDYAGQYRSFGAREGMVGLPTSEEAWRFQIYTVADYEVLYNKISTGAIEVDDCGSSQATPPELVRANVYFTDAVAE